MQVLHRHVGIRIDQLHAAIGLDIANEVHNVAELFLIRVTRDLTLLVLEDLHEEPLIKVIDARQVSLDLEYAQMLILLLLYDQSLAVFFVHLSHQFKKNKFFVG